MRSSSSTSLTVGPTAYQECVLNAVTPPGPQAGNIYFINSFIPTGLAFEAKDTQSVAFGQHTVSSGIRAQRHHHPTSGLGPVGHLCCSPTSLIFISSVGSLKVFLSTGDKARITMSAPPPITLISLSPSLAFPAFPPLSFLHSLSHYISLSLSLSLTNSLTLSLACAFIIRVVC